MQTIRADNVTGRDLLNDQMIAAFVERIDIKARRVRFRQSFAKFEIENIKLQPLSASSRPRFGPGPHGTGRIALLVSFLSIRVPNCVLQKFDRERRPARSDRAHSKARARSRAGIAGP